MKCLPVTSKEYLRLEHSFRECLQVLGYAESSVDSLPSQLREFFHYLESIGINHIADISVDHVTAFFEIVKVRPKLRTGGALSNNYLNQHLRVLRLFTKYLRETEQNPFAIEVASFKEQRNIKDILTQNEVQLLYKSVPNNIFGVRDKAMLSIYYGCGLRCNEGVQLDVSDILFERQMIYVRKGKHYTERYVPASPKLLQDMSEYVHNARPGFMMEGRETQAFFISERGQRIGGQSLALRVKGLVQLTEDEKLKSKTIGMHSLRHSIATHLLMGGMKLERIAKFLGHKTIESTQIYTHLAHELQNAS